MGNNIYLTIFLLVLLSILVLEIKNKALIVVIAFCLMGASANCIAKNLNQGRMPVFFEQMSQADRVFLINSRTHRVGDDKTQFMFLTDIFYVKYNDSVCSIGDFLITFSFASAVAWCVIRCKNISKKSFLKKTGEISHAMVFMAMVTVWGVVVLSYYGRHLIY